MPNEILARLVSDGILLKSDPKFPSVVTLVAGEPVRRSWRAHPASHAIFQALAELSVHPDALVVKLVGGKDTFVHRRLWPELLAIATEHEPWQFASLPGDAYHLFKRVLRCGELDATGSAAKLLEARLLVRGEQFHSNAGKHEKHLESWPHWARRTGFTGVKEAAVLRGLKAEDLSLPSAKEAKRKFEAILPGAKWPWPKQREGSRGPR